MKPWDQRDTDTGALVEQILSYSRSQRGKRVPVELGHIVGESLDLVRGSLAPGIRLEVELPAEPLYVVGDATQLHRVTMNLCTNAMHAMGEGGTLRVTLEEARVEADRALSHTTLLAGAYVCLTVEDSGTGMDPDTLERVFEPFFTTKEAGKGTGLGLATSYGMVRRHGGHIGVYSEVGQGTVIKVYLPQVDAPADASSSREIDPWKEFSGTASILVVEDDDALRNVTARMLETLGYRTRAAANSGDALRLLADPDPEGQVDLLLTDVVLRETDGNVEATVVVTFVGDIPDHVELEVWKVFDDGRADRPATIWLAWDGSGYRVVGVRY